jgi:hypothetical protein
VESKTGLASIVPLLNDVHAHDFEVAVIQPGGEPPRGLSLDDTLSGRRIPVRHTTRPPT